MQTKLSIELQTSFGIALTNPLGNSSLRFDVMQAYSFCWLETKHVHFNYGINIKSVVLTNKFVHGQKTVCGLCSNFV